ncbi:hypothetical protein LTR86_003778 [Recurvomyces mirabilis]|nr:hypothetical protein LTR86_003778 [Recurvomyces mirabilis]
MADRKLSLPTPSRLPRFKETENKNDDALISPDRMYNKVARLKGLAEWPVETFRRLSLRSKADPTYLTPDKVWPRIVRARERWMMQSERKEVARVIQQYAQQWQVKDAYMLGLSEFSFVSAERDFSHGENGKFNASNHYVTQLVYYLDTIALLAIESKTPIESFVQEWDRDWSPLEQQVLGAYDIKTLETPQSEERIGSHSFICLPWTPMDVQCDIIARCSSLQPALVFANAVRDFSSDANPDTNNKTIIGGLIHAIERVIDYDNEKAMSELLYADRSDYEMASPVSYGSHSDTEMNSPTSIDSHLAHDPASPGRPGCNCPSCLVNVEALHGDEGHGRMPEAMRATYEQRLLHLRKMRQTHIEIEVAGQYCLLFRDPALPADNEVCKYCQDQEYLFLPRKGAKWLAEGNAKQKRVIYEEPDHLETPYAKN